MDISSPLELTRSVLGSERLDTLFKLLLALVLGGVVGIEREQHNQPAGFRTHIVLCIGATLMMLVSIYIADEYNRGSPNKVSDPQRIAAQVVSGVGFLGAGAIMRMGVSIRGLTTAASLWTMAGIGLAIGCGYYFGAIVATVMTYAALKLLGDIERLLLRSKRLRNLMITARDAPGLIGAIERVLNLRSIRIQNLRVAKEGGPTQGIDLMAIIEVPASCNLPEVVREISKIKDITEVDIQ